MTSVSQAGPVWHAIQFCMPPHFLQTPTPVRRLVSFPAPSWKLGRSYFFLWSETLLLSLTWSHFPESLRWTVQILCSYSDWEHHTTVTTVPLQSGQPWWNHTTFVNPITDHLPLPLRPLKDHYKHFLHDWKYFNNLSHQRLLEGGMRWKSWERSIRN